MCGLAWSSVPRSLHLSQWWAAVILAAKSDLVTLSGFLSSCMKERFFVFAVMWVSNAGTTARQGMPGKFAFLDSIPKL